MYALFSGIAPTVPAPHPEDVNGTGWVFMTNSYNSDCSAPFLSFGVPVGQCVVEGSYAYKFSVVQGMENQDDIFRLSKVNPI